MDQESKAPLEAIMDCQHFLPAEMLLYIFGLLDPCTLVSRCRLVCKFWKDTVESSDMWKIQIRRMAVRNEELDSILRTAHNVYPWYICYAICENIFGTDLFPTGTPEVDVTRIPNYWGMRRHVNFGPRTYSSAIAAYLLGFSPPPEELLSEGMSFGSTASIVECSVYNTIDLYARGITEKILALHPPILINEWFTVRHDFVGFHYIDVILYNSQWDGDYRNGYFHCEMRTQRMDWYEVTHTFTNYRPDVRYVTFHHGSDIFLSPMETNRENDYHESDSKMSGAKVVIKLPDLSETTE